ncbi:hypothetical protein OG453_38515 [Streptomyces sp. NBC_01381]|uniref:hypothetical protein n=1 Tax=Streptomyces sp. NBC_01381 TaxID=2903845 RepID=UPI0022510581|nr:hypothetical protein [Streptomyces sp. NBC_01381]MCX4672478.1 hypothetical protein [Streptomyces sp. NBC_01381]
MSCNSSAADEERTVAYTRWPFSALEFAQQELDYALPWVICDHPGEQDIPVRAKVWEGADTETDPIVVLQAGQEDKAPGQLRAASMAVRAAEVAWRPGAGCERRP